MVAAGKMRGLAVFSDKRSTPVPEVPTMGETTAPSGMLAGPGAAPG